MFVLGRLAKTNACPVGTDGFVSLKLLVSACLVLLHHVGARVELTLRRCHRTEFSAMHRRVFFSPRVFGHVQAQPLAEARWVPAYDP